MSSTEPVIDWGRAMARIRNISGPIKKSFREEDPPNPVPKTRAHFRYVIFQKRIPRS